jgi:hypothetical protein
MKIQQHISLRLFLAAAILVPGQLLLGADVSFYGIVKVQEFAQTNDSAPSLEGATPFSFYCFAETTAPGLITNAFVQLPGGGSRAIESDDPEYYEFKEHFSSLAELNSTYGAGVYTLNIESVNDGTSVVPLTVPADAYPNTPQITNPSIQAMSLFSAGFPSTAGPLAILFKWKFRPAEAMKFFSVVNQANQRD